MRSVGIAIPALNAASELPLLLPLLRSEGVANRIVIVDSSSADGTPEVVRQFPEVTFQSIPRNEFNHGATRELARKLLNTDIVVYLTQDVVPQPGFLGALIAPIKAGRAVATYARQLPRDGAGLLESFPRDFNYPSASHVRTLRDVPRYGIYAFFCSDSAAAYSNSALDSIGGFEPTLVCEDFIAAARLMQAGGEIAYVAESIVFHSHQYSLSQEFRRYFDTGYIHAENRWMMDLAGRAETRGSAFLMGLLRRVARDRPVMIPYVLLQTAVKWMGYRIGLHSSRFPVGWCAVLSSQKYYWRSRYCRHGKPPRTIISTHVATKCENAVDGGLQRPR